MTITRIAPSLGRSRSLEQGNGLWNLPAVSQAPSKHDPTFRQDVGVRRVLPKLFKQRADDSRAAGGSCTIHLKRQIVRVVSDGPIGL